MYLKDGVRQRIDLNLKTSSTSFNIWNVKRKPGSTKPCQEFLIFVSFSRYGSHKQVILQKTERFFFQEKAVKNGREIENQNSLAQFWKQGVDENFAKFWRFPPTKLTDLEINSGEGTKNIVWETFNSVATMWKIPWQSRKELHLQLAASCGVYHGLPPWFSMHFKSIATFLAKSANEK